jgi:hypothetical protein
MFKTLIDVLQNMSGITIHIQNSKTTGFKSFMYKINPNLNFSHVFSENHCNK